LFGTACGLAQSSGADPYKQTLDRLHSLTRHAETEWRAHADVPHPEDPALIDGNWAEEDNGLILRFYEWAGKEGEIKLQPWRDGFRNLAFLFKKRFAR